MIEPSLLHSNLHKETALIAWRELQLFFAKGLLYYIPTEMDLVAVANYFSEDNAGKIRELLEEKSIGKPSNQMAKEWFTKDAIVWAVVVAPFVIVQFSHYNQENE